MAFWVAGWKRCQTTKVFLAELLVLTALLSPCNSLLRRSYTLCGQAYQDRKVPKVFGTLCSHPGLFASEATPTSEAPFLALASKMDCHSTSGFVQIRPT